MLGISNTVSACVLAHPTAPPDHAHLLTTARSKREVCHAVGMYAGHKNRRRQIYTNSHSLTAKLQICEFIYNWYGLPSIHTAVHCESRECGIQKLAVFCTTASEKQLKKTTSRLSTCSCKNATCYHKQVIILKWKEKCGAIVKDMRRRRHQNWLGVEKWRQYCQASNTVDTARLQRKTR